MSNVLILKLAQLILPTQEKDLDNLQTIWSKLAPSLKVSSQEIQK